MTLPHGWPINDFCDDCKDTDFARAVEAGRREAKRIEKVILDALALPEGVVKTARFNYSSLGKDQ